MRKEEYIVNLDLKPEKRWLFLKNFKDEINELLHYYLNDFEGAEIIFENIEYYKEEVISKEYLQEIGFIATITNFTTNEVLIANLYYDLLKFYLGCSAFAIWKNGVMTHARNLDWWTEKNMLSKHSRIFNFQKKGKTIYKTVGWLGFIGALSGNKPGEFSLTLNAVLSKDSPEIAIPVSFLLRDILLKANTFLEAKALLEKTTIASDCLVLLSGIKEHEMVVIERTPKRFATRSSEMNFIVVTNDYKKIENNEQKDNLLQSSSCGRYDKALALLENKIPNNAKECFQILKDEEVMMGITVQQMVFDNKTGSIELIKT